MKREKFDISRAHLLLASTLGVVFSSCNNEKPNEEGKKDKEDEGKDKYKDINEELKKMGVPTINEEKDLDELKDNLSLKGKTKEDVLNKLKDLNSKPNEKVNKDLIEKLKEKKDKDPNPSQDNFSNSTLTELIQKLKDGEDVNSDIKSLAEELLSKKTEIEKLEEDIKKDTGKKSKYDTIIKTLREKTLSVLGKDSKKEDIKAVKDSLTELKKLVIPQDTGDTDVLNNVKKIKDSLFKGDGPLKGLSSEVYENVFDFIVNENNGKLSLYIEFKNIDKIKEKKLVLKDVDCKKIFSIDNKDKSNPKDVLKDDEIPDTLLYKILAKCIEAISKIATISNDKIEIIDTYKIVSDNNKADLSKVDQMFKNVISKALVEVFTEIKEGSISVNDEFYQILGSVYSLLSIKDIENSDSSEEFFISNEEGEISTWLLKNLGIIKDGDDYVMLKDDKDSIKLDETLKKKITEFGNSISIKKKKVSDEWKGILDVLNKSISKKMKGKNADTIYQEIKNAFKTNNKNKDDERFNLVVFDDKNWGVNLKNDLELEDSEINGDGAKFENSGKWLNDNSQKEIQICILTKILTKRFNDRILTRFNAYKCLNGDKDIVDKNKYDDLVNALISFLKLDIIADLGYVIPSFTIKIQGSEVEPVSQYLKRIGVNNYNDVKRVLQDNQVENAPTDAFKLNDIILNALDKVKQGCKVHLFATKHCYLNDGLEFDTNSVKESAGTVGVQNLLLKDRTDDNINWLDVLAVIFKGNIDIYDNSKKIKDDAFANIFNSDVPIANAIKINVAGTIAPKEVKIEAAGKVTVAS